MGQNFLAAIGKPALPTNPNPTPQNASDVNSGQNSTPAKAPTQKWNGQDIPASINTKNLVNYDQETGNKTFKLSLPGNSANTLQNGGVYTEDKDGNLVKGGHTTYGGVASQAGMQRDDMIPAGLGGSNSQAGNIKMVPLPIAHQQDKVETKLSKDVNSGQIQPKAAITEALRQKAQISGEAPNTSVLGNNFGAATQDVLGDMFVKPAARVGVNAFDYAAAAKDYAQGTEMQPGKGMAELRPRTLPLGIGKVDYTDPNNAAGALQVASDTLNTAGEGEALAKPIDTIEGIGSAFKNVGSGLADKAGITGGEEVANAGTEAAKNTLPGNKPMETPQATPKSLRDVTPNYSDKIDASDKITNSEGKTQYRINPPGKLGSVTVNPNASEFEAAKEVDKIPDYSKAKTFTSKSQLVDKAISTEAESMRGGLQAEDKTNPLNVKTEKAKIADLVKSNLPKDIQEKIGYIGKDNPLSKVGIKDNPQTPLNKAFQEAMSSSEDNLPKTAAGRYYQKVLDSVDAYDGTREGKLDLRQTIDDVYKNARGKLAFGTDSQNALDETNTDIRNSVNKDLNDTSQDTNTKASLKKQSSLYDARDVLDAKAKGETTFAKRHPTLTRWGRRLAATAAVTGGIELATGGSLGSVASKANKALGGEINKLRGLPSATTKSKALPRK